MHSRAACCGPESVEARPTTPPARKTATEGKRGPQTRSDGVYSHDRRSGVLSGALSSIDIARSEGSRSITAPARPGLHTV